MAADREDRRDLLFGGTYLLSETSEAALEDYARALAQAREAEALRPAAASPGDPARAEVHGVSLLGAAVELTEAVTRDVEDFARALALDGRHDRLGWS